MVATSGDSVPSLRVFSASLSGLSFPVLGDLKKEVGRLYGVLDEERGVNTRSIFIIDRDSIVRYKLSPYNVNDRSQYEAALEALAKA
ncbi:MAG: redoxin domain-containing protein [Chloroflexi bacterium]|nr:redoxin domain-containing protein [Chloroflexota bacterium]